ncbi:glycosyltransferase family 4 protein [Leifsonia sp. AK011]|uniref:glycosyltransferase family 4 protein n=1 Tax=Leifsonia sp. AK011 TaxID=2723075 RepID=UPI00211BC9C3|nr:glycosyltransferase [Leifsonia sp. AK011]
MVTVHAADAQVSEGERTAEFLSHFALFRCASRAIEAALLEHHPDLPTLWVPCVVDLPAPGSSPTPPLGRNVVTVARLIDTKGFAEMMSVMSLVSEQMQGVRWTIVGGGPLLPDIAAWAKATPNLDVHLLGALPHSSTLDTLQKADAFLLLPKTVIDERTGKWKGDGLPVAILEAMWLRVPVIVTPVGGIPELVNEATGHLVDSDQIDSIVALLTRVLTSGDDASRLSSGQDAIKRDYLPQTTSARLSDGIESVMSQFDASATS